MVQELTWLLLMVRTVRNNLFHGGKFPLIPVSEPSRDSTLLHHSITILAACLPLERTFNSGLGCRSISYALDGPSHGRESVVITPSESGRADTVSVANAYVGAD